MIFLFQMISYNTSNNASKQSKKSTWSWSCGSQCFNHNYYYYGYGYQGDRIYKVGQHQPLLHLPRKK